MPFPIKVGIKVNILIHFLYICLLLCPVIRFKSNVTGHLSSNVRYVLILMIDPSVIDHTDCVKIFVSVKMSDYVMVYLSISKKIINIS